MACWRDFCSCLCLLLPLECLGRKLFNSNVVLESRNSFSSWYVPGDLASHEHPLGVWCYIYAVTTYIGSTLLGNGKCIHPYSKDSKHVDVLWLCAVWPSGGLKTVFFIPLIPSPASSPWPLPNFQLFSPNLPNFHCSLCHNEQLFLLVHYNSKQCIWNPRESSHLVDAKLPVCATQIRSGLLWHQWSKELLIQNKTARPSHS